MFDGYAGPISTKSAEQKRRATRCLTPTEWGWQDHDQTIVPVATDQPAAPRQLMNIVTCGCKTGCGNACGSGKQEWCAPKCVTIAWVYHATMHLKWILTASKLTQSKTIIERYVRI